MKSKSKRVTAADLVALSKQIEAIYNRALGNMQGPLCDELKQVQEPLVFAVGRLTLLEAVVKK